MGKYFFKFLTFFLLCIPVQSFCQSAGEGIVFIYDTITKELIIKPKDGKQYIIAYNHNNLSKEFIDSVNSRTSIEDAPTGEDGITSKLIKKEYSIKNAVFFEKYKNNIETELLIEEFYNDWSSVNRFDKKKKAHIEVEYIGSKPAVVPQGQTAVKKHNDNSGKSHKFQFETGQLFIGIAILVLIALSVMVVVILRKKYKKNNIQTKAGDSNSGDSQLEVVEVVTNNSKEGLDDIKKDVEGYYVMNMDEDYKETAVKKIYLHHTAVKKMYDFFKKSIENNDQTMETGCYFIGCWERTGDRQYNISVEDIVEPGNDIEPGEFSFNFGVEIGVKLFSKLTAVTEKTGRNFVHTVWMHSHPGLGLFLSSHDLLVQRQLTYTEEPNRLVAFVIDTNTPDWQLAVFTAKLDGTMNNKADNPHIYSLDELYQWSRSAHTKLQNTTSNVMSEHIPDTKDGYHAVQINHQGSEKTFSVYFGGKAINQIDDIIYKSVGGGAASAFVEGECDANGNFTIEDFSEQENENSIGILVIDGESEYDNIVSQYADNEKLGILLICRSDEEIWIVARRDRDRQFVGETEHGVCSMRPMKEWLRRRRKPC